MDEQASAHTSWVLARDGHRITCTLFAGPDGWYRLRLIHKGHRVLDEWCEGPQHALSRSFDAFNALVIRGWIGENSVN
jgi:hypothetical protein